MYANDGNHGTHHLTGPCMVTQQQANPWWAVDLGVALHVTGIKFTNEETWGKYVNRFKCGKRFKLFYFNVSESIFNTLLDNAGCRRVLVVPQQRHGLNRYLPAPLGVSTYQRSPDK